MASRNGIFGVFLLFLILTSACSNGYQKVLKSTDYDFKLSKAKEYYNDGQYVKALPLFEELMTVYKGTKDVEQLYYIYPYCHYGLGDYLIAAFYFENFLDYYPRSRYAEEARFMMAYCQYKMSPKASLEQTYTLKAIDGFQLFVNQYPESEKVGECNSLMDEMRVKLEEKAILSAQLYYDMKDYRAAAVAFNNVMQEFPETEKRERLEFTVLESYFLLAENSIASKELERYKQVVETYILYIDRYPESKNARSAEKMYDRSLEQIEKLKQS